MPLSPLLLACLAATWLIWGSTYLAIKFALESFPPFYQMGSRFLVAGLLLIAWLKLRGRAFPTLVEWRNAAIIGTLLLVSGMGFTAYSEQTVASGLIVAYIAVIPIIVTAMNLPFGVRPTRLELDGNARRRGRRFDARAGRGFHRFAGGARRDHGRLRELVARQRALAAAFSARAGRDGLRERDALRQRAAAARVGCRRRAPRNGRRSRSPRGRGSI